MRRYSQSFRLGVRFAYSQCCRIAFAFGQRVDSEPAAIINHRITIGVRDRPPIQPVAFLRLGCQRDRFAGCRRSFIRCDRTPRIVVACCRDGYGSLSFLKDGLDREELVGNGEGHGAIFCTRTCCTVDDPLFQMIPIRCFCGDRHLSCGSKRDHIAIFIFCSVILQLAILRFYLRTTGVLQQNGTLLHRAILVGHCEAYRVSSLVDCKPLANHA